MPFRASPIVFVLACALGACGGSPPPPPAPAPAPPPAIVQAPAVPVAPGHSLDLDAIDRTVKPGTDFFLFSNGVWLSKAEIPGDRAMTGVDLRLQEQTEQRTREIVEAATLAKAEAGSDTQKIGDFYASYLDEAGIEARGIKVMDKVLGRIAKLADKKALAALLGSQIRADVDPLNATDLHTDHVLGLFVEQDLNDPSRAAPFLLQGGLGMPDRSYYLDDSAPMAAHRLAYVRHLAKILHLAGIADAEARAARVLAFERRLAA